MVYSFFVAVREGRIARCNDTEFRPDIIYLYNIQCIILPGFPMPPCILSKMFKTKSKVPMGLNDETNLWIN
jgi:hypothetical protein